MQWSTVVISGKSGEVEEVNGSVCISEIGFFIIGV